MLAIRELSKDEVKSMIYEMPGRVRFSEVDEDGVLTLYHLINYLQDCSTFHAEDNQVGLDWSSRTGASWILASWQIHIDVYPGLGDRILVKTWAYSFKKCLGFRNYTIESEDGQILVRANSEWILMNLPENLPVTVPKDVIDQLGVHPDKKLAEEFGRRRIRMEAGGTGAEPFEIREHHLDTNHHVNNGQYIRMALNYTEKGFRPRSVRAEYKMQAHLGDTVVPRIQRQEQGYKIWLENTVREAYFASEFLA